MTVYIITYSTINEDEEIVGESVEHVFSNMAGAEQWCKNRANLLHLNFHHYTQYASGIVEYAYEGGREVYSIMPWTVNE